MNIFLNLYEGRIGREKYFLGFLMNLFIGIAILLVGTAIFKFPTNLIAVVVWWLVFWIPLSVRRWHDVGQSGWLMLLFLIPGINFIVLLVLLLAKSKSDKNQYGNVPTGNEKLINRI